MSGLILHQYPTSPYGEIVRLALGLKGLAWSRVEHPNIMPRPLLAPLTGGYRKIPVLQVGADIYCDTAMILREIDRRFPDPPLTPPGQEGLGWALRAWAERAWFGVTVAVVFAARGDSVPAEFIKDREALSGRPFDVAALKAVAPMMSDQWRAHAAFIEERLAAGGDWLMGPHPGLADLAAFLNVWFLRSGSADDFARLTGGLPRVAVWAARMDELGHGSPADMSAADAFAVAKAASPEAPRPSVAGEAQGLTPGMAVAVMADDYGRDPVAGEIVFVSPQEIAIARKADGAGDVVVHFPRAGFWVRPLQAR
jgi:glutathione S-transferase